MAAPHPVLVECAIRALGFSVVDMSVLRSTLRTKQKQQELFDAGMSQTLDSLHLPQASGYVHAIDLGAYVAGRVSWRSEHYFDVAEAMQSAARQLGAPVTWGGCWSRIDGVETIYELHSRYIAKVAARPLRANGMPHRPFFDGPHFQLPRDFI